MVLRTAVSNRLRSHFATRQTRDPANGNRPSDLGLCGCEHARVVMPLVPRT